VTKKRKLPLWWLLFVKQNKTKTKTKNLKHRDPWECWSGMQAAIFS
jgi:hypothetical protein